MNFQSGSTLLPNWRPDNPRHAYLIHAKVARLARKLSTTYDTPDLGNQADPLDEAVFILLTYQTDLARARQVWSALKKQFPTWESFLRGRASTIQRLLRPSGFQRTRERVIRQLLVQVAARYERLSLDDLDEMDDPTVERELRALPGFDIKGARCVMLYSLDREVFPVDSNIYRFARRYGILEPSAPYRRKATHDELQAIVPPANRRSLHINLVVHGQVTCVPRRPHCHACVLRRSCATGRAENG